MLALVTLSGCGAETLTYMTDSATSQSPLKVATARALTTLGSTGGFTTSKAATVSLPVALAGQASGSIFGSSIADTAYRAKLAAAANTLAEAAVPAAKALIESGVSGAEAVKGTSPHPATDALEKTTSALVYPLVTAAIEARLTGAEGALVAEALGQVIGIDRAGFIADVAQRTVAGIFAAIGVEEASILGNEMPA